MSTKLQTIYATTNAEAKYLKTLYRNDVVVDNNLQRVYVTKVDTDKYKTRFVVRGDYYLEFISGNKYFDIYIHKNMPTKEMNRLTNHLMSYLKVKKSLMMKQTKQPFIIYRQSVKTDEFPMMITNYFLMALEPGQRELARKQMMKAVMPYTD